MSQQKYELEYTFSAYLDVSTARRAFAFLPWPILVPWQPLVELKSVRPSALADYLVPKGGFFYAFPIEEAIDNGGSITLSYVCELTVASRREEEGSRSVDIQRGISEYLRVNEDLRSVIEVSTFLDALPDECGRSDFATAKEIYQRLCSSHHFSKTTEVCQCMSCSTRQVLSQEGAHCTSMARTFIALCRLLGIPAREITGALAGHPEGSDAYLARGYNRPLFVHTWAEVFLRECGWIPVEFHGIAVGPQALTAFNVASPMVRREIEHSGPLLEDYYFGQTDCARVTCSNSAKSTPQLLVVEVMRSGRRSLLEPGGLSYECTLEMSAL